MYSSQILRQAIITERVIEKEMQIYTDRECRRSKILDVPPTFNNENRRRVTTTTRLRAADRAKSDAPCFLLVSPLFPPCFHSTWCALATRIGLVLTFHLPAALVRK